MHRPLSIGLEYFAGDLRMFRSLWTTFPEGIGYRRFAISGVVGIIIAGFYFLAERFTITSLLAIPHWAVGSIVVLGLLLFWMLQYADRVRRELEPKIELSCDPDRGCVVETPVLQMEHRDGGVVVTREYKAVSVRVWVKATSKIAPKNVAAFMTKFEKQRIGGGGWESSQHHELARLTWVGDTMEVDLSNAFPQFVNALHIAETDNLITFWGAGMPLSLRDFFKTITSYRLTIAVIAEGMTREITFVFVWKGQWNTIELRPG
jgi:hypothetical protein